jgi:hypothetical protein
MKSFETERESAKRLPREYLIKLKTQDEALERYAMQLAPLNFSGKLSTNAELQQAAWIITGLRPMFHVKKVSGHFEVIFQFKGQSCVLGVNRGPVEACRIADMFFVLLKEKDRHRQGRLNFSSDRARTDLENEPLIAEPIKRSVSRVARMFMNIKLVVLSKRL